MKYKDDGAQVVVAHGLENRLAIIDEANGNIRAGKRQLCHNIGDIAGFCCGALEKLAAHRRIEKQILDDKGCALRAASLADIRDPPALNGQLNAAHGIFGAGGQLHFGNRGDGRQRFSAEPQRADV